MRIVWLSCSVAAAAGLMTQQPDLGLLDNLPAKGRQYILYTAEQQVVPSGKRGLLELRFHVLPGFHVNSHTPRSELLMATQVEFTNAPGVKVEAADYAPGKLFSFPFSPEDKLDVYSDEFSIKLPVHATTGPHELHGSLHYQACDQTVCYPPRTLPVALYFVAK